MRRVLLFALSVRLEKVDFDDEEGPVLYVSGVDMMDGTPVFDIKPYIPYADSHPDGKDGWLKEASRRKLKISFPDDLLEMIPEEKRKALFEILSLDPGPAYQDDPERVYGMKFAGSDIRFRIEDGTVFVVCVERIIHG